MVRNSANVSLPGENLLEETIMGIGKLRHIFNLYVLWISDKKIYKKKGRLLRNRKNFVRYVDYIHYNTLKYI